MICQNSKIICEILFSNIEIANNTQIIIQCNGRVEIDAILKEKQKKDSDTHLHLIKFSIFNLNDKVMKDDGKVEKNDNFDMDADETQLCMKLDKINEKIMDLIK